MRQRHVCADEENVPGELPATMRVMVMREFGDPGVLRMEKVPVPRPGPGEAVVRVAAVGVSRNRDVATRSGRHPFSREVTLPHVLGGGFAGTVAAVGEGVDPALVGRPVGVMNHHTCGACAECRAGFTEDCSRLEVLGIHRWGSYADFTAVHAGGLRPLPHDLDMAEAAALAATGPVALTQLRAAGVGPGTVVLVTGMTGALASTLAVLARVLGATVIGLSRRRTLVPDGLGCTVLDSTQPGLTEAIVAAAGGSGPRAVIDNICTPDVFEQYFPALANGARIVVSGVISAPELPVPARSLYIRSVSLIGLRSHTETVTAEFWQLVRDGFRLPPGLLQEFPLELAAHTHKARADGTVTGHTVLRLQPLKSER
jgi:D-arabinose 1-dehydrogenase-like Zn-dependent alcohol dehydrogenase